MTEEEKLRKQLSELQSELEEKNKEAMSYLDEIEQLEEQIMKYEEVVSENASKKIKKALESKYEISLESKDREIRELKDRMGVLRKEKTGLQAELEIIKASIDSSVISVEELREKDKPPLNALLQELQDKLKKRDSEIRRLKQEKTGIKENEKILADKDEEIKSLKESIELLTQQIEKKDTVPTIPESKMDNNLSKALIEDLQVNLKRKNRENKELKKKLEKYEKKKGGKEALELEELKAELKRKELEISELKKFSIEGLSGNETMEEIVEELKNQLKRSKSQVKTLQDQLKLSQAQPITNGTSNPNFDEKLKIQREMASFLQKQLDEANQALKIKEEEIATIKNEAIRIKRKYEDLDSSLKQRDSKINKLQSELDSFKIQTQAGLNNTNTMNPNIVLRIKELESMIDDLNKQNIQQRLELSHLRKRQ